MIEILHFIDGQFVEPATGKFFEDVSEPFQVDFLPRGDHNLQLTKKGYNYPQKAVTVDTDKVLTLHEKMTRLFIPDTVVRKSGPDGTYELTGQIIRK